MKPQLGRGLARAGRLLRADALGTTWMILSPLLAVLAILMLLGLLLWLLDKDERQSQREDLIRDALWVEQALQFQFRAERDRLVRLAQEIADGKLDRTAFAAQAQQLRQINRELVDIALLDGTGTVVASAPPRTAADVSVEADFRAAAMPIVRSGGRGAFTPPFTRANGQPAVAFVASAASAQDRASGSMLALVTVFSLDVMLAEHVPWWIAERRALFISDGVGNRLASRSRVAPDANAAAYTVQVGPPLINVSLDVVSYRERTNLAQNGLVGAMVALGLFAVAGLLARERHMRRRREAEAALDDETAFRQALERSALVGMRGRDLDGRLLYVNPAFCRMIGYDADELIGLAPPMPYWMPEDIGRTQRLHDAVLAGQSVGQGLEFTFRHRDGTRVEVLIYEEPWLDAAGMQRGWLGSVLDISDRKRAEEREREQMARLQQTARLVTMGEMASLLAHDLNQPLAAIQSYQTGLVNRLAAAPSAPSPPPSASDHTGAAPAGGGIRRDDILPALSAIGQAADRAGRIVRRVQDFVRKSDPRLEPIDLAACIEESVALLEPEARRARIAIEIATPPDLPRTRADRVLLTQVLVNLLRNAVEALAAAPPERRRIRVEAAGTEPVAANGRARVEVVVRDWGPGIAPAIAATLFQPFVSTKSAGLGLGLTICRSIIEVHGSRILYESAGDGGAVFRFALDAAEPPAAPHTASNASSADDAP